MDGPAEQRTERSDLLQNPGGDSSLWIHFRRRPSGSPSASLDKKQLLTCPFIFLHAHILGWFWLLSHQTEGNPSRQPTPHLVSASPGVIN